MDRAEASTKIEDLLEKKNHGQTGAGAVVDRSDELKDDVSLPWLGSRLVLTRVPLAIPYGCVWTRCRWTKGTDKAAR